MSRRRIRIPVAGDEPVSAILDEPETGGMGTGIILAHGAGRDMTAPLLEAVSTHLSQAGFPVLRFNFPYMERGRKAPDRPPVLERTWASALSWAREQAGWAPGRIVAGGKSMGGRIASQMAAAGTLPVAGLFFLGYPLHPPGRKDKLRDAHLPGIECPMLFFAGTRDPLCDLDKLGAVLPRLRASWRLEIVEGGDHSFRVLKSLGLTPEEVHASISAALLEWLRRLETGATSGGREGSVSGGAG